MRALKFSYFVGVFLVLAPPCFPHFVKAALGFRLGHSPTEQAQQGNNRVFTNEKKGVGVQLLSGVNNGGWQNAGGLKAAASGYGTARSAQGGALDAHAGQGSVRHLRILGLNLYLGGRAAQFGIGQPLVANFHQPQIIKKSILGGPSGGYTGLLGSLGNLGNHFARPLNLGANIGAGVKPHTVNAPNGGKNIGGIAGIRASVGSPNFGVGFNLGYRQGVNTKSPLGWALGLSNHGQKHNAPLVTPALVRGQDQVILSNGGLLRGHGHGNQPLVAHAPVLESQNIFLGFPQSLESPIISTLGSSPHISQVTPQGESIAQPIAAASNQQPQKQPAPKSLQKSQAQSSNKQQIAQPSVLQPQQIQAPHQQRAYNGPLALGSTMRNNFLSFFRGRPSILRPSPYQYSVNSQVNQQALGSGPVRSIYNHHQQVAPAQRPQGVNDASQGWSTLYPLNGQHVSHSNPFINPIPVNGQSLSKLQANFRPGTVTNVPLNQQQLQQAQQQIPYVQQHQQPRGYGGFLSQGLRGLFGFGRQPPQQYPQQYYPQQRPAAQAHQGQSAHGQAGGAPQQAPQQQQQPQQPSFNFFQQPLQNPFQNLQNFQNNFAQNSPFFSGPQHSPVQATLGSNNNEAKQVASFPVLPQFPFAADSPAFTGDSKFRYSHSTHSKPINIGSYTLNMDVTNSNPDAAGAASASPIYGPGGRRIKKTKKTRGDIIIMKKQDESSSAATVPKTIRQLPLDIMETAASSNQVTLTSSLGSTSWTPMVVVDPPKLLRKSLESPVSTSVQVIVKKPEQPRIHQASGIPNPPSAPNSPERTMILRKRRLNEGELSPTVVPPAASTSAEPSSTVPPSTTASSPSSTDASSTAVPVVSSTVASA